jgi:uncharacterized protein (DUF1697 family)
MAGRRKPKSSEARAGRRIALLRGINVGSAKRVAMADLRDLVAGLGYRDVRTLLNSGNVVFDAPSATAGDPAARIEKSLEAKLGVSARVTVLTAAELASIVEENPLRSIAKDPSRLLVAVPSSTADRRRLVPLTKEDWSPDALALGKRAAYLWCAGGILESRLAQSLGRTLRDAVTTRNWATMLKLHALANDPS